MMNTEEKLMLSARPGKLTLIREGMFLKCYQQSLFSLVHAVYPDIKVTGRRIKKLGGQAVFSGGFPEAVLAKVLPDAQLTDWAQKRTRIILTRSHISHGLPRSPWRKIRAGVA